MQTEFDFMKDPSFKVPYQATQVDEATFVALAEAFIKDYSYLDELDNAQRELADKFGIEKDFLGLPYFGGNLFTAVSNLLGDDFSYWYYDCEQSFEKFNDGVTLKDGTHPDVHSLSDLWDFSKKLGEDK